MTPEPLFCRLTRQAGRCLGRWGVDPDQYHWLLQASITLDFRSTSALQGHRGSSHTKSALKMTAFTYGVFSLLLATSLRAAGLGTFLFSIVTLAYAMTMVAMSILIEFGLVVTSPDDFLILAHRPVSSRTFFAVKCSNLLFYTLLIDLALTLMPALVGWTLSGAPWQFPFVYMACSVMSGVFVAAGVAAVYGLLLQRINYERFKDLLAWCQVLFTLVFFLGYQLIPRLLGRAQGFHLDHLPWAVAALPPAWFAGLNELGLGHFSALAAACAAAALVTMTLLLPGLLKSVSLDYSDRIGGMIAAAGQRGTRRRRAPGPAVPWLERLVAFNQEERALFGFILKMLRRNRQLKLQLYPTFGMAIAFFALGAVEHKQMTDPLAGGPLGTATMFPLMVFLFSAIGVAAALPYSDEHAGGWIFHAAPLERPERFLKAVKKAVFVVLFIPLFLLDVALFSVFWPVLHAVAVSLYGLALGLAAFQAMLFWFRSFPFTRKPEKGAQSRGIAVAFVVMAGYGLFFGLMSLFRSWPALLPAGVTLLLATAATLGFLNNRAYARAIRLEDEPPA